MAEGDIISVDIEGVGETAAISLYGLLSTNCSPLAGDVAYRIMALQPESSKKIDSSLREIIWQVSHQPVSSTPYDCGTVFYRQDQ